jgi:hypothetical protein
MSRGQGPYFQLVRSYRQGDRVRQELLVHLGEHETPEAALEAWPGQVERLRRIGRDEQADKLAANLEKLRALVNARKGEEDG